MLPFGAVTVHLSRRERDVLTSYARSWSLKQTAHELGVRETTARHYSTTLREKVGARSLGEAVWKLRAELDDGAERP